MESSAPSAVWIALAVAASLLALIQAARTAWARLSRKWTIRARSRRATDGELRAEPMLRRAGYEVLERQVRGSWTVYADGVPLEVGLRADLLVLRDGRRYVAEVKTGTLAPSLHHAATRRQLLEYRMAFGVDGVLLVDAESERVSLVEMGDPDESRSDPQGTRLAVVLTLLVVGVALGVVLGWSLHGSGVLLR